jgi:hypothetical protein
MRPKFNISGFILLAKKDEKTHNWSSEKRTHLKPKALRDPNNCASDDVSSDPHTESHVYFSTLGWMSCIFLSTFNFHFW